MRPSVCVIGAGVSGLTTGIALLERGYSVTIIASAKRENTTSSVAAAFWYPFWTGEQPDHSWYKPTWAWESYLYLQKLVDDDRSGVTRSPIVELVGAQQGPSQSALVDATLAGMWWRAMPDAEFEVLNKSKLGSIAEPFPAAIRFQTLVVNMSCYLPYQEDLFRELGGHLECPRHIDSGDLQDLLKEYDFIVNCAALGSRELVGDAKLIPKEGIVLHLPPIDAVREIFLVHTGPLFDRLPVYVVPRGGPNPDLVLGGTIGVMPGDDPAIPRHIPWSDLRQAELSVQQYAENILVACRAMVPSLGDVDPVLVSIGYRPARVTFLEKSDKTEPVRLEPQVDGPLAGRLVHNYGHGGGGVTLSWGCAQEVCKWIDWLRKQ